MAIHGILRCYERADRWFCGAIVTDGTGGPVAAGLADSGAIRDVRRREQERAATLGRYGAQVFLDHASADVRNANERAPVADLVTLLRATRPEVVYTHALSDAHDTHVAVALRLVAACRELAPTERPSRVFGCEVWRDLDWLPPSDQVALAVDERLELQSELVAVFESQLALKRYDAAALGRRTAHAVFSDSRASDRHRGVVWAMDLSPLVSGGGSPADFLGGLVRRFEDDILARLTRLS
jgi:LmbE family N-acetylglucosaminyl deacetylase